jgi:ParB/RepB/Spo0J family partition protein
METEQLDPRSILTDKANQRKEIGDLTGLIDSIRSNGLINPIAVNKIGDAYYLIAGKRRLLSFIELQRDEVPCHVYDNIPLGQYKAIEHAENFHRKNLTWQEDALAVLDFHESMMESGDYSADEWTLDNTAVFLKISRRAVTSRIRVARALRSGNERVLGSVTLSAAYNVLQREDERAIQTELADAVDEIDGEFSEPTDEDLEAIGEVDLASDTGMEHAAGNGSSVPLYVERIGATLANERRNGNEGVSSDTRRDPDSCIYAGDFLDFSRHYSGPKFNLLHLDPPYGLDHDTSAQGSSASHGGYADSEEDYWSFLQALFDNHSRLMQQDCHILLWFSMKFYTKTRGRIWSLCKDYDISFFGDHPVNPTPLIWYKNDNTGIISDAQRGPRHIYETCMLITLGDRKIVKSISNVVSHPARKKKAKHLSEKPLPVVEKFLSMLVDQTTVMGDFCCGSGGAIAAAHRLGAKSVAGLDLDETHVKQAKEQLRWAMQNPIEKE